MIRKFLLHIFTALFYFPFKTYTQQAPIVLHNQRELFIDNYLIDKLSNIDTRLATPVSGGTALQFNEPWEGKFSGAYVSVINDGTLYRMYYRGSGNGKGATGQVTCYAESTDGINWVKPKLALYMVNGTNENNVVVPGNPNPQQSTQNFSVYYDINKGISPEEKYKAVGGVATYDRPNKGLFRYVSGDGLHWRRYTDTTALFTGYGLDSQNVLTWLPSENCYAIYLRMWTGDKPGDVHLKGVRTIARSVSKDFIHWSEPVVMQFGEAPVENLYTNATHPYYRAPQILISLPFRFSPANRVLSDREMIKYGIDSTMWKGVSDAVLMTSRGGNVYERKFLESFVRPGLDQKNWAARSTIPALGVIPTGANEMSFFVTRNYGTKDCYLQRMTLRTDGFASLHAGYTEGYAITKPFIFSGNKVLINYSASSIGYVKVVLLGEDNKELTGFGEGDAELLRGDKIDREVTWKNGKTIKELSNRRIRIKLVVKDADIYSFAVYD